MKRPSPREMQAARWALLIRDPEAAPDQIEQALDWIETSEGNRRAFDRVQRLLDGCDGVDREAALQLLEQSPETSTARISPQAIWSIAASVMLGLLALLAVVQVRGGLWRNGPAAAASVQYASQVGQVRQVVLNDGSSIVLSGGSTVTVAFDDGARNVELVWGEALFTVAPDPNRPFVVKTGLGTATALGTAFNVHRQNTGATVTVVHGQVAVKAVGAYNRSEARLGPAMQVNYLFDGSMSPARTVDLNAVLAWRGGTLIFSRQPLNEVINDLNRYSTQPILLGDQAIGDIPITAAIRVEGIGEWLRGLQNLIDVSIEKTSSGLILRKKPRTSRSPAI